jgi:hypothetical protein
VDDREEDTGDWEPPKRRGGLMVALVLGGLVLVLVCSGGLWVAWRYLASSLIQVPDDIAAYEVPSAPTEAPGTSEPSPEGQVPATAPGLDGVAEVEPSPDPAAETPPAAEPVEPAPVTVAAAPDAARDRPAYTAPASTAPASKQPASKQPASKQPAAASTSPSSTRASSSSGSQGGSTSSTGRTSSGSATRSQGSTSSSGSTSSGSSYGSSQGASSSTSRGSSSTSATRSTQSTSRSSAPSYTPEPVSYDAGEDLADASTQGSGGADSSTALLDRYAAAAANGGLSSSDIMVMEMVQPEDSAYTRSRLLLVMNSRSKGDPAAVKRYLDELSLRPENQYNPVVLAEYARYYVNKQDYQRALDKAVLAERHWARLPPELVFTKKAEIYEVEAAAYQGLFYRSEDNLELLDKSIRQWKKYREHVLTESRTDLQTRADREIEKLENIKERLQ